MLTGMMVAAVLASLPGLDCFPDPDQHSSDLAQIHVLETALTRSECAGSQKTMSLALIDIYEKVAVERERPHLACRAAELRAGLPSRYASRIYRSERASRRLAEYQRSCGVPSTRPPPVEPDLAPTLVGAAGLLLAGASVGFHLSARERAEEEELARTVLARAAIPTARLARRAEQADRERRHATLAGHITLGVGAALGIVAVALALDGDDAPVPGGVIEAGPNRVMLRLDF